jgi:hypothetical protein
MNTMTNKNDIRELTIDELDMVEGASAEGIAASTSAVGGMTAVHGMWRTQRGSRFSYHEHGHELRPSRCVSKIGTPAGVRPPHGSRASALP